MGLLAAVVLLLAVDFLLTRRPHEVSMREALGLVGVLRRAAARLRWLRLVAFGSERGMEYLAGYLVEKSLSVDNLFVFMLLLGAFAVPRELQQRVLLYGIVGALVLRAIFIALGAAALQPSTGCSWCSGWSWSRPRSRSSATRSQGTTTRSTWTGCAASVWCAGSSR